jgi:polyisoprenoid-binding protein YceI
MNGGTKIFAIILSGLLALAFAPQGDIYFTRDGHVSFYSKTDLEDIKADNNQAAVIFNKATGAVDVGILINAFQFKLAKMQEHFNETYMESTKYPKATFKGTLSNLAEIKFATPGVYPAKASGTLTMHGVSKPVTITEGTIEVKGNQLLMKGVFNVNPADYNIAIPAAVKDKIAKSIRIQVDCTLNPK